MIVLLVFSIIVSTANAFCPIFLQNQTACTCADYDDGAIVKCSGPHGPLIVEELKKTHAEVRELFLENANIVEIGSRAFKNLRIKKLVLDNNRIISIQKDAFRGLEGVLQELSINQNRLTEIPTESIQGLRALNVLSVKCNDIGNISNVVFQNMPSLIEVNLACNKICKIDDNAFSEVKNTLQNIILDNNCLHSMPTKAIEGMPYLIALHIKYNQIEKLNKNDLQNMTSLSMLTLTGNSISQISKTFTENTPNLRYIYLGENVISSIEPGTMKQLSQAEIIDLSYNNLSEITVDMFSGMENLQHLNLEANAIKDVAPGAFATTPLLLLWLPYNCISVVSPNMFQGTPFLKQVSLAHNNIKTVQPFSFAHLANLHTLDLSYNMIKTLQTSAIMGSDFLTVRVQENPLVCNQDGFHVMNGREAINLTTEANLVCRTDYAHEVVDKCPRRLEKPARAPCCRLHEKKKSVTTTPIETSTMTIEKKLPTMLETTLTTIERTSTTTTDQTTLKTTTESRAAMRARKLNMERFQRLQRPPTDVTIPHIKMAADNVVTAKGVTVQSEAETSQPTNLTEIPTNENFVKGGRYINANPTITKTSFAKVKEPQESSEINENVKRGPISDLDFSHDSGTQSVSKKDEEVIVAHRS